MSRTIDERVVEMQFENEQFEKGAKESISTLDKLKSALKLDGATKGVEEIQKSADKFSLHPVGEAIEAVANKFSMMEIIAITALSNITNRAINTGIQMAKSLSVDNIRMGWGKYEEMINSQQTIMSAVEGKINKLTGEVYDMSSVTDYVNKLRWYSDETSYNLDQMTNAVGNFTSSGLDLAESTELIMGVANACADAGVSAEKADSAFYAISKAIGGAGLTLGVWNNQLKTSGLTNSERFKQSLLDTAAAENELIRIGDKLYTKDKKHEVNVSNLTDTLSKYGWATPKVLSKVFASYSDTVDGIFGLTNGGKIDLSSKTFDKLTEAMVKNGKTVKELGLDKEYAQASEAIAALKNAYEELGVEIPKSLKAFMRAQEAVSFTQAIDATGTAVISGWAQTYEIMFGNYEEAKRLWTSVSNILYDIFAYGKETRNEYLQLWHDRSYESWVNGITDGLEGISQLVEVIRGGFRKITSYYDDTSTFIENRADMLSRFTDNFANAMSSFRKWSSYAWELSESPKLIEDLISFKNKDLSSLTAKQIADLSDEFKEMVKDIGGLDAAINHLQRLDNIKNIIAGIGNSVMIVYDIFAAFYQNLLKPLITTYAAPLVDRLLSIAGAVGVMISNARNYIENEDNFFKTFFKGIYEAITVDNLEGAITGVKDSISELFTTIKMKLSPLGKIIDTIKLAFERLKELFESAKPIFSQVGEYISNLWTNIHESLIAQIRNANLGQAFGAAGAGIFASLLLGLKNIFTKFSHTEGIFSDALGKIRDAIWDFKWDNIDQFFITIKSHANEQNSKAIMNLARAVAIMAASILALSFVDSNKLASATISIGAMVSALYGLSKGLSTISTAKDAVNYRLFSTMLIKMAAAVLILAVAIKEVGKVEPERLLGSVLAVSALVAELAVIAKKLSGKEVVQMITGTEMLMKMAKAVLILAVAMKITASIDSEKMAESFFAVSLILGELTAIAMLLSKSQSGIKTTAGTLIGMSVAVLILAGAVLAFGKMDYNTITQGLTGVGVALLEIAAFVNMSGKAKHLIASSVAIMAISASLIVMAGAVALFGKMKATTMLKGLTGLGAALLGIAIAANAMSKALPGAVAMTIMAGALLILAPALLMLGNMGLDKIGNMVLALGAAFATLGVISLALGGVLPLLLQMSAVIAVLGVGFLALGAGITALSTGIAALGVSLEVAGVSIIGGIKGIILGILETIAGALPLIADIIVGLVVAVCDVLVGTAPKLVDTVVDILVLVCKTLTLHAGTIIDAAIKLAIALINGLANAIAENAGPILGAVANLIDAILILALEALKTLLGWIPGFGDDLSRDIDKVIAEVRGEMDARSIGTTVVDEITDGVKSETPKLTKYMAFLQDESMVAKLRERIEDGSYENIGTDEIHAIIDGILEEEPELAAKIEEITGETIDQFDTVPDALKKSSEKSMMSYISGFDTYKDEAYRRAYEIGAYTVQGYDDGMDSKIGDVTNKAGYMIRKTMDIMAATADIRSPSRVTMRFGEYIGEGLAIGLSNTTNEVNKAGEDLITDGLNSLQNAAALATSLFDTTVDLDPVIRPVVDLTEIQNGVDQANGMLDFNSRVGLSFYPGLNPMLQTPYGIQQTPNNVTVNFNVSTQGSLNESDIRRYGREIADVVNYELGRRVG